MTNSQIRTGYTRQLGARDLREGATFLGLDVYASWSSKIYFYCQWRDMDPPPTTGTARGPRGEVTAFSLPAVPPAGATITLHDWDAAIQLQLEDWKYGRDVLRWHAPGHHIAICTIAGVAMPRPLGKTLEVGLLFTSVFYYDPVAKHVDFNFNAWPDLTEQVTDGRLYGSALGIIPPPP